MINPSDYVVLDVETNGFSSLRDDLLSISIYKPDENKMYNRFLPLELDTKVHTTKYNGITKKMLRKATPLCQDEVNALIKEYELDKRTILTYGNLDEKFIRNYFKRKGLVGYSLMRFHNFKRDIISSSFSSGNITKDNLCNIFNIDGVSLVHSGENDCLLEWKLFCKMEGKKFFVRDNQLYELTPDYIVPTSYLSYYPNFKFVIDMLPKIKVHSSVIYELSLVGPIEKNPSNITGISVEHLIYSMVHPIKIDSSIYLAENSKNLKYIGEFPSYDFTISVVCNKDGTLSAVEEEDREYIEKINNTTRQLKSQLSPLIHYIKYNIFQGKKIYSQELVVNSDSNCLSLCDLSNKFSVVEIKTTSNLNLNSFKYQLYYQSLGRDCYVLQINWSELKFVLSKVFFEIV